MAEPSIDHPPLHDLHDFLDWVHGQESRYEFVDGRIIAMAGGSRRHNDIQINLIGELRNRLRGGPCRVNGPDLVVSSNAGGRRGRFPDASITCEFEDDPRIVTRPSVLFEILSPDTEATDRGQKWAEYSTLPSLRHYVLIAQDRIRVEHYRRLDAGWHYQLLDGPAAILELDPPGLTLPLHDLYADLSQPLEG